MKKSYYLFNPGRLGRKDNTLKFTPVDEEGNEGPAKYIPVETVDNLFAFGSLDAKGAMYNFFKNNPREDYPLCRSGFHYTKTPD